MSPSAEPEQIREIRSHAVWKPAGGAQRFGSAWAFGARRGLTRLLRRIPGLGGLGDAPRSVPFLSDHRALDRWSHAPYGIAQKPAELEEIPWDYVRENRDEIPFVGLREYWYPALKSAALRHDGPQPIQMLGDQLVLFRDAQGRPRALENRCPHRGPMLSLGQVGVYEPGTITCRYHGMTFDGEGTCVAVLSDGPDSPACRKAAYAARAYPADEAAGIVFVYMGEKEPPPLLESVPHLAELIDDEHEIFAYTTELPFNHLAMLDNEVDLSHVSCLHRTCSFGFEQKLYGRYAIDERPNGGFVNYYTDDAENPHVGTNTASENEWYLPGLVYFPEGALGSPPDDRSYFWAVPRDVGNCAPWIIVCRKKLRSRVLNRIVQSLGWYLGSGAYWRWPGSPVSCLHGPDRAIMTSVGRVARWDRDKLLRTDRGVAEMRKRLKAAHRREREEAAARAVDLGATPGDAGGASRA